MTTQANKKLPALDLLYKKPKFTLYSGVVLEGSIINTTRTGIVITSIRLLGVG